MSHDALSLRACWLALAPGFLLTLSLLLTGASGAASPPLQAMSGRGDDTPLILVHGYEDSCENAFAALNQTPTGSEAYATTTLAFLRAHGWKKVVPVGYYNASVLSSTGTSDAQSSLCGPSSSPDAYLPDTPGAQSQCNTAGYGDSSTFGTVNDPLQHVACELAWFIFTNYTSRHQPVAVLAHSMGGLLIRAALGESGPGSHHDSHFPPVSLLVKRVVMVATPDGLVGAYYTLPASFADTQELEDMNPLSTSSTFMQIIGSLGKPQGPGGTFWGLVGASDPAAAFSATGCPALGTPGIPTGSLVSCLVQAIGANGAYPDGDGIVSAQAMMAFPADYKILYGALGQLPTPLVADLSTAYEHEANWCFTPAACLNSPFYLNDGTPERVLTRAWICTRHCNQSDLSDLHIGITTARPALHSLAEIAWLLAWKD